MFPDANLGIGPTTDTGFYYDFDLPRTLIPEDLEILQKKMDEIVKEKQVFKRVDSTAEEAKKFYSKAGQSYKVELIEDLAAGGDPQAADRGGRVGLCQPVQDRLLLFVCVFVCCC